MVSMRPGPSSTDRGLPVRFTGSPTVTPAAKKHYQYHAVPLMSQGSTSFLVYLDRGLVCLDSDHFSYQFFITDFALLSCQKHCFAMYLLRRGLACTHQFVHSNTDHVLCGDDRARDGENRAILVLVTDAAF